MKIKLNCLIGEENKVVTLQTVFAAQEARLFRVLKNRLMKIAQMIIWEWELVQQISFPLDANICKCMIMRIVEYQIAMNKVTANT